MVKLHWNFDFNFEFDHQFSCFKSKIRRKHSHRMLADRLDANLRVNNITVKLSYRINFDV